MAYTNNNEHNEQTAIYDYCLTMNMNNICRICLEKGPKLMPIFDPIKPPHFSVLIMACASVQVTIVYIHLQFLNILYNYFT